MSLGKVPGGGVATRTTDVHGQVHFGVLPVLPNGVVYEITIGAVPEKAQVEVAGARGGTIMQKNIEHAVGQRAAATTIRLDTDGKTPLVVSAAADTTQARPMEAVKSNKNGVDGQGASRRSAGNKITSRMLALSVSSIISRSMPTPQPPVGGMPYSSARTKSWS